MKTKREFIKSHITGYRGRLLIKDAIRALEEYEKILDAQHEDKLRLDKLQKLTKGYGNGWTLRESMQGRGMRLHESSSGTYESVRDAIDCY